MKALITALLFFIFFSFNAYTDSTKLRANNFQPVSRIDFDHCEPAKTLVAKQKFAYIATKNYGEWDESQCPRGYIAQGFASSILVGTGSTEPYSYRSICCKLNY